MAQNLTGLSSPSDFSIGRGIVYFAPVEDWSGGKPVRWRDLGNAPEMNVTLESEDIDHTQRRSGLATVDKSLLVSQSMGISFTLDEINNQNLADLFSGQDATLSQQSIRDGFTAVDQPYNLTTILGSATSIVGVISGRWFDLHDAAGERVMDLRTTSSILLRIKGTFGGPINLVEAEDYTLDRVMGRVFILTSSTRVTYARVVAGAAIFDLGVTAAPGTLNVSEVRALTRSAVIGALKFIAEDASDGSKQEYQFHRVTLRADGDVSLVGDDWTLLPFEGTVERYAFADPDAPFCRIRSLGLSGPVLIAASWVSDTNRLSLTFNQLVFLPDDQGFGDISFRHLLTEYNWNGLGTAILSISAGTAPGTSVVLLSTSVPNFTTSVTSAGSDVSINAGMFRRVESRAADPLNQQVIVFPLTVT